MSSELHELRAVLIQAINKIDAMMSHRPNPHLPVLVEWLKTASQQQMRAAQLYVLVKEEFAMRDLPPVTQQQIAEAMRYLGYVNKRSAEGMRWQLP